MPQALLQGQDSFATCMWGRKGKKYVCDEEMQFMPSFVCVIGLHCWNSVKKNCILAANCKPLQ
jgi:hypothetical protein